MRITKPLLLCVIVLFATLPLNAVNADSVEVCCESGPVELFLIGSGSSATMSPFDASLGDESEEYTISDAIAQHQEIASWESILHGPVHILHLPGNLQLIMKSQTQAV